MVRAKVRADLMRTDGTQMVRPDERGIVDAAAAALVGVTLKHRRIIGETIQIAEALMASSGGQDTDGFQSAEDVFERVTSGG